MYKLQFCTFFIVQTLINFNVFLFQGRILKVLPELLGKLDAGKSAMYLYETRELSRKQLDVIQRLHYDEPTRAAEELLDFLLSGNVGPLMDSVTKTGQRDVGRLLTLEGDCTLYLFCCKNNTTFMTIVY